VARGDPAQVKDALELHRVRVPLRRGHHWAQGRELDREVVLVGWTRAGVTGWGECPTLTSAGYATETTEEAWQALVHELGPASLAGRTASVGGVVAASAALADARLDARLRTNGLSLVEHLGARRRSVPRTAVLADLAASPAQLADRADAAAAAGARLVKVKIAPGHDELVLAEVAAALEGRAGLAADANGSYSEVADLAGVDAAGLVYLEQPFDPSLPLDELVALHAALRTPIALDESLVDLAAVRAAVELGAADVVSVKPARLGGVQVAAAAVELAAAAGVRAFVGGMLELGIGRSTAAAVAALDGCTLPTDLGPSSAYVSTDVCEPVVVDGDGDLVVPDGEGCGRVPDPARLVEVAVDVVRLEAP
jgi:O-succinylbenzoate synthase